MIKAKKSLGQNFLIDQIILNKIVDLVNIQNKAVLEIGPGTGNLTRHILKKKPKKLIVIEKDNVLAFNLQNKFRTVSNEINSEFGKSIDNKDTLAFLSDALEKTSAERDKLYEETTIMETQVETLELDSALLQERGNQIFNRLEEAVDIALAPLSKVLNKKGINTKSNGRGFFFISSILIILS